MGRSLSFLGLLAVAVGVAALVSNLRAAEAAPTGPRPTPQPPEPEVLPLHVRALHAPFSLN
jgi:hypothetical protein